MASAQPTSGRSRPGTTPQATAARRRSGVASHLFTNRAVRGTPGFRVMLLLPKASLLLSGDIDAPLRNNFKTVATSHRTL